MPQPDFLPVIMGTGLNAYNLARSIYQAYGVKSLAIGRFALRETAGSQIIGVRTAANFEDPDGVVECLIEIAQEFPDTPKLLIPTIEFYTNVVLQRRSELEPYYQISLVDLPLAERLMNKTEFYLTCEQLGVPHPKTVIITPAQANDPTVGHDLPFEYPIILKPSNTDIYPRLKFEGRKKVYLLNSPAEVQEIAGKIFAAGYDDDLILQEYLAGDESVMRVANSYSDENGKMVFLSIGQIILGEYNPTLVGNYNAVVTIDDPELTDSIRKLLDGIGYRGPANFDIMIDKKTGVSKILELNLRPGAASFYTMAAGGNLASYFVEDQIYHHQLAPFVTTAERLWLNVPYPVARHFAPRELRGLLAKAHKAGTVHTLDYQQDNSLTRKINRTRVNLRHTLDYFKFARSRLSK